MIKYIYCFLAIICTINLNAQDFYSNNEGEFVCVNSDTICYKIVNRGSCFLSYRIGKFLIDDKVNFNIGEKIDIDIYQKTASLVKTIVDENVISLSVNTFEKEPFPFVDILIKDSHTSEIYFDGNSDINGKLILSEDLINLIDGKSVIITIFFLGGYFYENQIVLNRYFNYDINWLLEDGFYLDEKAYDLTFYKSSKNKLEINKKVQKYSFLTKFTFGLLKEYELYETNLELDFNISDDPIIKLGWCLCDEKNKLSPR